MKISSLVEEEHLVLEREAEKKAYVIALVYQPIKLTIVSSFC
jgi:hypothetical protein